MPNQGAGSDTASPSPSPMHSDSENTADLPSLAVLDPVDLVDGKSDFPHGEFLRTGLAQAGKFKPMSGPEMQGKLREFAWNRGENCHEFQCGFEAGNVLLTDYVLFGTITPLKGLYAFTFNILHIASGKVVNSEVGDVPRSAANGGDEPLKARLAGFVSGLDPARFRKAELISRGLMAVVDLSPASPQSRVLSERITTHVNSSRQYDLMSQSELRELLAAVEIRLGNLQTTDSGMIALGSRLNVAYLVHSKLSPEPGGTRLDLALFDVAGKRRIRDWPVKPTQDFHDILNMEHRFFTTLMDRGKDFAVDPGPKPRPVRPRSRWTRGALSIIGVSASAGLATLAVSMRKDADGAFDRAESALSVDAGEPWKRKAEENDRRAVLYGSLAALTLGASLAVWTF
jgi:hypothetical protein